MSLFKKLLIVLVGLMVSVFGFAFAQDVDSENPFETQEESESQTGATEQDPFATEDDSESQTGATEQDPFATQDDSESQTGAVEEDPFADESGEDFSFEDETVEEDLDDEEDVFLQWGYDEEDEVEVDEVGEDFVVIKSPLLKDGNHDPITLYKVLYTTEPGLFTKDNESLTEEDLKNILERHYDDTQIEIDGEEFTLKLEDLDPETDYYAVLVPKKGDLVSEKHSNEIEFTTEKSTEPQPEKTEEKHEAPNYDAMNPNVTLKGKKEIVVNWNNVEGVENVEIFAGSVESDEKDMTKKGEVPAQDGKFSFMMDKSGTYKVKLIAYDSEGTPYTLPTPKPVEVKAAQPVYPDTGPATNILIGLLVMAMLGYILYRAKATRK